MIAGTPNRVGLTTADVEQRRLQHGENRLPQEPVRSVFSMLAAQFESPLIYIIGVAALISLSLGERGDALIITIVVAVDVILGFAQEYKANQTYLALRNMLRPTATVLRNGKRQDVETWEIVPDDLVLLAVGDKVVADGVLMEATRVAADEALLTGESEPIAKDVGATVFMGSTVVTGRGLLRVTATGIHSELGKIAASIAAPKEAPTPLQLRLSAFASMLTKVVLATTVTILVIGLVVGQPFLRMLRTAIVLSVAAVPEGLIIAVTVILVAGMRKVLRRHGLVKRLLAVETLGSVTVICTDKTGTLTEGRMRVTDVEFRDPEQALRAMVLCNDLEGPVDIALWEYAEQHLQNDPQQLLDDAPRFAEELFTSETKFMIAAVAPTDGDAQYFLKGAPEIVLSMCVNADAQQIARTIDEWADRGLRNIGIASRSGGDLEDEHGYTWLGLIGMEDPVREGVVESVRTAQAAGVRIMMLTGDYRRTAESIARSTGISSGAVLDGAEIAAISDDELRSRVREVSVLARIKPHDKLRIVQALRANGDVTAMIGDGVNDAPALKTADIGVVVGSATDVAKETADLILLDNNFGTVVAAIEEGRVIYDNIRKVVAYVLSDSFAEVLTIFIAILLGWPAPLSVAQILWIHLICDGPEDIVLGFEPKEDGIMDQPPRSLHESILDRLGATLIATISGLSAVFGLGVFGYYHLVLHDEVRGRSIVFAAFAISSVIYILAYRSLRTPIWQMHSITANKPLIYSIISGLFLAVLPFVFSPLGTLLRVVPLTWQEWSMVFGFAFALLLIVDATKALANRRVGTQSFESMPMRASRRRCPPRSSQFHSFLSTLRT